jgi:predicted DCC family thiol-disulfide oxidoreductase YuxK
MPAQVILFDGVCNFCNFWVKFVIKRDRQNHFKFASLQSDVGKQLLLDHALQTNSISTVVFIDEGVVYTQSSAALRICKYLDGGWKLFYALILIPKFIRDAIYDYVGAHRYQWFGQSDTCMLPDENIKKRFL